MYSLTTDNLAKPQFDSQQLGELRAPIEMRGFTTNLDKLFNESTGLEQEIKKQLSGLHYE
jgi:type I restriction enzyme M protein